MIVYPGLASWYTPTGGMFLWIKFTGLEDSFHLIMEKLVKRKVLFVAGKACNVSEKLPCPYARVSFSLASEEDMEKVRIGSVTYKGCEQLSVSDICGVRPSFMSEAQADLSLCCSNMS